MDKEASIYKAQIAEQAERYDEMVSLMKGVAQLGVGLTEEERNLLSVAYKNVIGVRRSSWRTLSNLEAKQASDGCGDSLKSTQEYRWVIEKELHDICDDVLEIVNTHLLPIPASEETKVFYYKMKGDYLRYLAEFVIGTDRNEAAEKSLVAYKEASDIATSSLPSTHQIRLGLALNFSVFYYEILNSAVRACDLAKTAFDAAYGELDTLTESSYKDSTLIMQLLRDNLTLWTSEMRDEEVEKLDEQTKEFLQETEVEDGI